MNCYLNYVTDMLPFYFDLLITYLNRLDNKNKFSETDFEIFMKIIGKLNY
jgi:hypothetical protein